jgi:hypothetical protein
MVPEGAKEIAVAGKEDATAAGVYHHPGVAVL